MGVSARSIFGVFAPLVFLESLEQNYFKNTYISRKGMTLLLHHAVRLMVHRALSRLMMLLVMNITCIIPPRTFKCTIGAVSSSSISLKVLLLNDIMAAMSMQSLLRALEET